MIEINKNDNIIIINLIEEMNISSVERDYKIIKKLIENESNFNNYNIEIKLQIEQDIDTAYFQMLLSFVNFLKNNNIKFIFKENYSNLDNIKQLYGYSF